MKTMHNGETVELVVRRDNISITELSRRLNVSRRSIYNWFTQENLSVDIICKIGEALNHDFSVEFPDMFNELNNRSTLYGFRGKLFREDGLENSVQYWRDKYITLLEKHNDYLRRNVKLSLLTT